MEKTASEKLTNKWLSVPIIATITRLLCCELTLQNEYLRRENKILKSKIKKRISFTDEERRTLVESARWDNFAPSFITQPSLSSFEREERTPRNRDRCSLWEKEALNSSLWGFSPPENSLFFLLSVLVKPLITTPFFI